MIKIVEQINTQEVINSVHSNFAGAVNVFVGTVRNNTKGRNVRFLDFEAYESMALNEMKKIAQQAKETFQVENVSIVHAKGIQKIGDTAVVIAVSAPHRKASFLACEYCIDTLKETVPIWKKEYFEDGEVWVSAHP